jgi:TM2 domain-containing membrane protein YozV
MEAGWYPDADHTGLQRYWDGNQWTEHTAGVADSGPSNVVEQSPFTAPDAPVGMGAIVEQSPFAAPESAPIAPIEASPFASPAAPAALPAPGWLPDPEILGGQRYWDGAQWTEHRTGAAPGAVPAQAAYGYPQQSYGYPPVSAKNPALSLIVSFFIPGVGSMINGDVGKGVGILIGYIVSLFFSIFLIGIPFALGLWIWGMVDAYRGAVKWNARHGIAS